MSFDVWSAASVQGSGGAVNKGFAGVRQFTDLVHDALIYCLLPVINVCIFYAICAVLHKNPSPTYLVLVKKYST